MTTHADLLIVGAGSAGSVVATRLSADSRRRVLVLEAGSRVTDPDMRRPELWPFIQHRDYDWAYVTTEQPRLGGRRLEWARGKGIGGSSLIHANAHMRGCRADFNAWVDATGDARWSWESLLPYFRRLESYTGPGDPEVHGTDGPLPVLVPGPELYSPVVADYLASLVALGAARLPDHNGGEMLGAAPNSLTIRGGERVTTGDAWLDPALDRPNLELRTGATVHRLLIEGDRVTGVIADVGNGPEPITADTVVLCAGSIADPLLLMRSGVGPADVLAEAGVPVLLDVPGVGQNLHDHLLGAGNVYLANRAVPPTKLNISESMSYQSADGIEVDAGGADIVVGCVVAPSMSESLAPEYPTEVGTAFTLLFGVTNPTSRGSLRITGPGVDDPVVIDPNYLDTEHDRAMFRLALQRARQVARTAPLANWVDSELLPGAGQPEHDDAIDEFIGRAVITHHHPVSTLRMGRDDDAPVTPDLAFRGLRNLYVVDASVIPSITAGPVHASVLAIAESFADHYSDAVED